MQPITEEIKPKKSKAVRSSAAIIAEIESLPSDTRKAFSVIEGHRREIEELDRLCIFHGTVCQGGSFDQNLDSPESFRGLYLQVAPHITKAVNAKHFRDLIIASPEGKEAIAILTPLFAELAEAQEREQIIAQQIGDAERELRDAKATALEKLQAQVDHDPAVVEAQRKLEPYRRKGGMVTA